MTEIKLFEAERFAPPLFALQVLEEKKWEVGSSLPIFAL